MTRNNLRRLFTAKNILILLVVDIALAVLISNLTPSFFTARNAAELLSRISETNIAALAQMLVIMTGGFDLSLGATFALSATVASMGYEAGFPFWLSSLAAIAAGALVGSVNAFFIVRLRMQPIIVTLATMTVVRSIVYGLLQGRTLSAFPDPWLDFGEGRLFGVPYLFLLMLTFAVALAAVLGRSALGRRIVAIGTNPRAAFLAGIRVNAILTGVYVFAGITAAFAGLLMTARVGAATGDAGLTLPLEAVAAVLVGGTLITGGRGSVVGTTLGILTIFLLRNGFSLLGVTPYFEMIVLGLVLLGVAGNTAGMWGATTKLLRLRRTASSGVVPTRPSAGT